MKRYIPIVASLMVFSLISCDEVMDLFQYYLVALSDRQI